MALSTEDVIQNRYRILRILKSGGMGSVYEAVDTKLADSPCAVKEIHDAALQSRESGYIQTRFYEEMKALAALDHPAIPKVRDYINDDNAVFIVMDLVQGQSLDEEVREKGPLEADLVVLDMIRLLDALEYLHSHSPPIVHRDIKPANILRDRRGGIKLVDFGLARETQTQNTQTVVGTMGYCAPEQMMGKAEARSDLYSVGVTMVHLLTGVAPEMDLFEPRRPELPRARSGLTEIIERATQPRPNDRYASAEEMSRALQVWLHGKSGVMPAAVGPLPEPTVHLQNLPGAAAPSGSGRLILAGVAIAAALGAGMLLGGRNKAEAPTASKALVPTPAAVVAVTPTPKPKPAAKASPKPAPPVRVGSAAPPPAPRPPAPPRQVPQPAVRPPAPAPVPRVQVSQPPPRPAPPPPAPRVTHQPKKPKNQEKPRRKEVQREPERIVRREASRQVNREIQRNAPAPLRNVRIQF